MFVCSIRYSRSVSDLGCPELLQILGVQSFFCRIFPNRLSGDMGLMGVHNCLLLSKTLMFVCSIRYSRSVSDLGCPELFVSRVVQFDKSD